MQCFVRSIILCLLVSCCMLAHAAAFEPQLAEEILQQVNQYRAKSNLPALVADERVAAEAQAHSIAMARHAVPFGHEGFASRIERIHSNLPEVGNGAENVAYHYQSAKIVVDGWMQSPGHRKNILGNYNLTGIGLARDDSGQLYFTQLFVKTSPNNVVVHSHAPPRVRVFA